MAKKKPEAVAPAAPVATGTPAAHELSVMDAFAAHREEAERVPAEAAPAFRADLPLALHNARVGVEAVAPHLDRLATELPALRVTRVRHLPNLVRAVMHADSLSGSGKTVTREEIDAKLAELQAVRQPALLVLQAFAMLGLADTDAVAALVEGRGTINFAGDGIGIEHTFVSNRVRWAGKHPFTDEQIAAVGAAGNWLLNHVLPDGATPRPLPENEYDVLRRALWSLATEAHTILRKAGIYQWGEDGVDAHIPKLQTRVVTRGASGSGGSGAGGGSSGSGGTSGGGSGAP